MLLRKIVGVYSQIYVEHVSARTGKVRDFFRDKTSDLRNNHCALKD
jgi:hypothetical protein